MKKTPALRIHIPEPCNQDWTHMTPQNGGRYCNQCTKVVYDFSQMTDAELLQFFKTKPEEVCGRFYREQLNREIKPVVRKRSLPVYVKKMAAAIFAAFSLRTVTAQVQKDASTPTTVQPVATNKTHLPERVTIIGRVTKGNNEPVINAKVSIDSLTEVYTDAEGKFRLQLSGEMVATHNLYFSFEGLERAVRNFHPMMGSTEYDVRLTSKDDYNYLFYVAGGIRSVDVDFPSIRFPNSQHLLSEDSKAILSLIAEKLKIDPGIVIKLVAFGNTRNEIKNANRKLSLIQNFLIKDLSISRDRIFKTIDEAGSNSIIDVIQYHGE